MTLRAIRVDDFTGGLNLDSNAFQVKKNQTSDLLNVDLNPKGGVSSRWGFKQYNSTAIGGFATGAFYPSKLWSWNGVSRRLMLAANNGVYHSSGGNFTSLSLTTNNEYGASFASWDREDDSVVYIARGAGYQVSKWDGSSVTSLTASGTGAWQNDLTTPSGTHAPKAEHVVTHVDRLWVAGTTEGASTFPNRIRFSHPLFPESWREDDYIDIPAGGSKIVALVPFGGHLIVFKQRSVWAIYGYSEDTFQVVELSRHFGAMTTNAVAAAENGIYFFSNPEGVFFYDGRSFKDLFIPLRPLAVGSEINESASDAVSMGYANGRAYLSLPSGDDAADFGSYDDSSIDYDEELRKYDGGVRATRATTSFVYDPAVGSGAWTAYKTYDGFGLTTPIDFLEQDGTSVHVAAHPYLPYVVSIDSRDNGYYDRITSPGATDIFESYYVTGWQDADNVSAKKFWRRPEFVMRKDQASSEISIAVYHDWDADTVHKTFNIFQDGFTGGASWQSWLAPDFGAEHHKTDSLGVARSVQLKISGVDGPWAIYSITYKFNPRKIQG